MVIISDPHGCLNTFIALLNKIPPGEKVVVCGDLIDRGPSSPELVEYIISNNIDCIRGNHEDMMINNQSDLWLLNGGDETLSQYKGKENLFKKHLKWMETLPFFIEYKNIKDKNGRHLIVSHSGIVDLDLDKVIKNQSIIWNRIPEPINNPIWFNVFGHTPVKSPIITDWFANIDTGCAYKISGYGKLTALRFPQMEIYEQENID